MLAMAVCSARPLPPADTSQRVKIHKVNKYKIVSDPTLDSLVREIGVQEGRIRRVWIGGSASPEGPVWWNLKLGEYRSRGLADYILQHTGIPESLLKVEALAEDWDMVVSNLDRLPDFPHRDRIYDIIAGEPDWARRKSAIRALDSSRTWYRLIREVFPNIRNSRIRITLYPESLPTLPDLSHGILLAVPPSDYRPARAQTAVPLPEDPRYIAVKTNLIFAAALVANIGVEAQFARHWTIDLPFYYSPYDITPTRKIRLFGIQPELRYWFDRGFKGHFVGLHTTVMGFNVALNDHGRYQDPNRALWGLGLGWGYAVELGKAGRWGLEFNAGAGYMNYEYRAYRNFRNGPLYKEDSGSYWGLTRAGVTLSYRWRTRR